MMPDSVPLTQPGEPPAASVVSRLGEIRAEVDNGLDVLQRLHGGDQALRAEEVFIARDGLRRAVEDLDGLLAVLAGGYPTTEATT